GGHSKLLRTRVDEALRLFFVPCRHVISEDQVRAPRGNFRLPPRVKQAAHPSRAPPHKSGCGNPTMAHAARIVLSMRQAIVIGPTPPGTGVMAPATSATSAKATSPTIRFAPPPAAIRLIPISITVAPGLIHSRITISGLPTA